MFELEPERWRQLLAEDGEFLRAARGWTGSFAFVDEDGSILAELERGGVTRCSAPSHLSEATVTFTGPADGWRNVLSEVPPPHYQDLLGGAVGRHGFTVAGDLAVMAAYYGAIVRAARLAGVGNRVAAP